MIGDWLWLAYSEEGSDRALTEDWLPCFVCEREIYKNIVTKQWLGEISVFGFGSWMDDRFKRQIDFVAQLLDFLSSPKLPVGERMRYKPLCRHFPPRLLDDRNYISGAVGVLQAAGFEPFAEAFPLVRHRGGVHSPIVSPEVARRHFHTANSSRTAIFSQETNLTCPHRPKCDRPFTEWIA